jgi:hypothetical protein
MNDGPIIVTAWATAGGTVALALVGAFTLRQGRKVIKSAGDQAQASRDLVVETRNDRDLLWQPIPSVSWPNSVVGAIGPVEIHVQNSGGGPAVSMRYVGKHEPSQTGYMTKSVDVPAGQFVILRADLPIDSGVLTNLITWQDESGFNHNSETIGAILTKDVLGNRYRFIVVKDRHSQPIIEKVERCHHSDNPRPVWSRSRDVWPDYGL